MSSRIMFCVYVCACEMKKERSLTLVHINEKPI